MSQTLTNQCPEGNTQEPMRLVIHGPTWRNTMPFDAHAMTNVLPLLKKPNWEIEADDRRKQIVARWIGGQS